MLSYIKNNINRPTNWSKNNVKGIILKPAWDAEQIQTPERPYKQFLLYIGHSSKPPYSNPDIFFLSKWLRYAYKNMYNFRHKTFMHNNICKNKTSSLKSFSTTIEALHANVQQYSITTV